MKLKIMEPIKYQPETAKNYGFSEKEAMFFYADDVRRNEEAASIDSIGCKLDPFGFKTIFVCKDSSANAFIQMGEYNAFREWICSAGFGYTKEQAYVDFLGKMGQV